MKRKQIIAEQEERSLLQMQRFKVAETKAADDKLELHPNVLHWPKARTFPRIRTGIVDCLLEQKNWSAS